MGKNREAKKLIRLILVLYGLLQNIYVHHLARRISLQSVDYLTIACAFSSIGIFSMAYRSAVLGMTDLCFMT
jgi:hypothetical protein